MERRHVGHPDRAEKFGKAKDYRLDGGLKNCGDDDLVAARGFGLVEGSVGGAEEFFTAEAIVGKDGDADGDGDVHRGTDAGFDGELSSAVAESFGAEQATFEAGVGKYEGEFFAAVAAGGIVCAA